jgi:tRNA-2-methylthio-N6-dimethylallyladenosine synthase
VSLPFSFVFISIEETLDGTTSFKFFVKTYECEMNERNSKMALSQLQCAGYELIDNEKMADVAIVNTYNVWERAEIKKLRKSRYLARSKRANPTFKSGIMGYMAEHLGEKLFKLKGAIDFIIGPKRLHDFANVREDNGAICALGSGGMVSNICFSLQIGKQSNNSTNNSRGPC